MASDTAPVTLKTLAARLKSLDRLTARLDALEQENRDLRAQLVDRPGSVPSRAKPVPVPIRERVSRRGMLRRGLQAAAVTAGAGVLLQRTVPSAGATSFETLETSQITVLQSKKLPGISSKNFASGPAVTATTTSATSIAIWGRNNGTGDGVLGESAGAGGVGVHGASLGDGGSGVRGTGQIGVSGSSGRTNGYGVLGEGDIGVYGKSSRTGWEGVYGQHTGTSGHGVVGDGTGANIAGVLGRNAAGYGVHGEGAAGVVGKSSRTGWEGVYGQHTGTDGYGVVGDGKGTEGAGVLAVDPAGYGLRGEGRIGVVGAAGYGGQFGGGKAQLRLVPGASAGKPTTGNHAKGELYMDSAGTLFICVKATTGTTAAVWRKVSVTAV